LQLTGLRLARRKQEGGPALRAFMFILGVSQGLHYSHVRRLILLYNINISSPFL